MSNDPQRPDEPEQPEEPGGQNPFKGTPFEQIFDAIAGGGSGLPGGLPDLGGLLSQMQAMMSPQPGGGPVNWTLAKNTARRTTAQQPDPSPTGQQTREVADAFTLADHWLDEV